MSRRTRPWTQEDDDYLRLTYGVASVHRMQEWLGRAVEAIDARAHELGLGDRRRLGRIEAHIVFEPYARRRHPRFDAPLPVARSDFLRPPTRAQLMAGR